MDFVEEFGLDAELILWGSLIILTLIGEMATVALVAIWFMFGAIAAFISAYLGQSFLCQMYWFVGVSTALFVLVRPLATSVNSNATKTNTDSLVGETAVVKTAIDLDQGVGRVEVQGLSWLAKPVSGKTIPEGVVVRIERIEGATLYVSEI